MSKIDLVPITGAQNLSAINDNFQKVNDALNDRVLYRDNPIGEPNQVKTDVDMDGRHIYNLPKPLEPSEPVRLKDLGDFTSLTEMAKGYAEASEASAAASALSAQTATVFAEAASTSAVTAQQAEANALLHASDAASSAVDSSDSAAAAAASAAEAANKVGKTSDTGVALLPEGTFAQRPPTGEIPANGLLVRGSTEIPSNYWAEYWDRGASVWRAFASRTGVDDAIEGLRTWVNARLGFTIIYPNGGTAVAPANISINSRYVMANPFPGKHVVCIAEVLYDGNWGDAGWMYSNGEGGRGVRANMLGLSNIVVQTGRTHLLTGAMDSGSPHIVGTPWNSPLQSRVKVFLAKGEV